MSTHFPATSPFSGIADLYEGNDWNAKKLWDSGVRMISHKMGQWKDGEFDAKKAEYDRRKAEWTALGGIWGASYLPYAGGTAEGHFERMERCDSDPNIQREIDIEDDGSGKTEKQETISALV